MSDDPAIERRIVEALETIAAELSRIRELLDDDAPGVEPGELRHVGRLGEAGP